MRILLDANILISHLLSSNPQRSATHAILHLVFAGRITLLYAPGVIDELNVKLGQRADLAARIPPSAASALIQRLRARGVFIQPLPEPYPGVTRDPKDDYLIAHAVVAEADYLVSWDRDLLDLREIGGVKIVSPPRLLAQLRSSQSRP